jgi:hypothetical protein
MSGWRSLSHAVRWSMRCLIEFTFQVAMRMADFRAFCPFGGTYRD